MKITGKKITDINWTAEFHEQLKFYEGAREIKDSLIHVHDRLRLCWTAAQSIFGDEASTEDAFEIYDRMIDLMDHWRIHHDRNPIK